MSLEKKTAGVEKQEASTAKKEGAAQEQRLAAERQAATTATAAHAQNAHGHPGPVAAEHAAALTKHLDVHQKETSAPTKFGGVLTWVADQIVAAKWDPASAQALADLIRAEASRIAAVVVAGSGAAPLPPPQTH